MRLGLRRRHLLVFDLCILSAAGILLLIWPMAWLPIVILVGTTVVASWVLARMSARYFHRALSRLRVAADALGQGDLSRRVEVTTADEIAKLVRSFNQMADRLERTEIEQRRLREELVKNEKLALIGEMAATVAHEVNNPLDGMQNCSRILRRHLDNNAQGRRLIDLMDNGLYRIEMMIRRLLTLARDEVTTLTPRRLDYCVADALTYVAPRLQRNGVRVVRDFPRETVFANVDRPKLSQALINLMLNAADAMPNGGELTIRIEKPDFEADTVTLSIRDTGAGMPSDVADHIFEPFYSTKDQAGTGLGLPVVQKVIQAHQGKIDIISEPGQGSEFRITLRAVRSIALEMDPNPLIAGPQG